MRVQICVDGREQLADLWALQDWLAHEPELADRVRPVAVPPAEGELGATEVLEAVLGGGGALAALATSLKVWFAQPRRADVKIIIRRRDRSVELDAKRVADVASVISALKSLDSDGD